jgi:hypothetical protein
MIFYAKVIKQIDEYRYAVKRMSNATFTLEGNLSREATVLSQIPTGRGASFKAAAPDIIDHLYAIVVEDGVLWYIIGFVPISTVRETANNEAGGFCLATADGTKVQAYTDGSLNLFTSAYSQMVLEPKTESVFSQFKRGIFKWWTGSTKIDIGTLHFYFAKDQDKTALPVYKTQTKPDYLTIDLGVIEDSDASISFVLNERHTIAGDPDFVIKAHLGVDKGEAFGINSTSTSLNCLSAFAWLENGNLTFKTDNNTSKNKFDFTFDAVSSDTFIFNTSGEGSSKQVRVTIGTGDTAVKLEVGPDKCVITIDSSGNVKIKTTDGANIFLGGQGKEQPLVTKSWVDQAFSTHIHPTTSPGAPTMPPSPDLTRPPTSDNPAGHFTYTTKAE